MNIPVAFDNPTQHDFELFRAAMQRTAGKNVLVHCQANLRGPTFVFLYRVIDENASSAEAASMLTAVRVPNRVWMNFLNSTLSRYGKAAEVF